MAQFLKCLWSKHVSCWLNVGLPKPDLVPRVSVTEECRPGFQFEFLLKLFLLPRLPWGHVSSDFSSQLKFVFLRYESAMLSCNYLAELIKMKQNTNHLDSEKHQKDTGITKINWMIFHEICEISTSSAGQLNYDVSAPSLLFCFFHAFLFLVLSPCAHFPEFIFH